MPLLRVVAVEYRDTLQEPHRRGATPRSELHGLSDEELAGVAGPHVGATAPTVPSLEVWSRQAGPLHVLLTRGRARGAVDIPTLVRRVSELELVDPLPRHPARILHNTLWVLLDRRPALTPIWADQTELYRRLVATYGKERVRGVALTDGPWADLQVLLQTRVHPGDTVLALGEFAPWGHDGDPNSAWAQWARRLAARKARPVAISFISPDAPPLFDRVSQLNISSSSSLAVEPLLPWFAYTLAFEPGHLRQVRRIVCPGGPEAELALWNDDRVERGGSGWARIHDHAQEELRRRFRELEGGDDARREALALQLEWRVHTPPELWAFEYVALVADGLGHLVPEAVRSRAETFIQRLAETRGGGSAAQSHVEAGLSWVWELQERLPRHIFGDRSDLGRALQKIWGRASRGRRVETYPEGFDLFIAGEDEHQEETTRYQLRLAEGQLVAAPADAPQDGSWLADVVVRERKVQVESLHPEWATKSGFDEYGRWASFDVKGVEQRMRWIEPGAFSMGSPEDDKEAFTDERPQHEVTITEGYWMADTPCTQAMWRAVMGTAPSRFKGDERPVEQVSAEEADEFCRRLSVIAPELRAQLPTEAEWERACRAGDPAPRYGALDAVAWHPGNSGRETHPVAEKGPNWWGLYDTLGNVFEWCADGARGLGQLDPYAAAPREDPLGDPERPYRVVRGGSWLGNAQSARAAYRNAGSREARNGNVGFRVSRGRARGAGARAEPVPAAPDRSRGTREEGPSDASPWLWTSSKASRRVDLRSPHHLSAGSTRLTLAPFERPDWATRVGCDPFGLWADLEVAEVAHRLRWMPPGRFTIGSPEDEQGRLEREGAHHLVTFTEGFWIGETPCTQDFWTAVMGDNPSRFVHPERPVERVNIEDIYRFCAAVEEKRPGARLGLPTEAQWEYACRAGTSAATYAGAIEILGDRNAPGLDDVGWYAGNSGVDYDLEEHEDSSGWPGKQFDHTQAGTRCVRLKQRNPWGLYDMLGNVFEWCADGAVDWNRPEPYAAEAQEDPVSDPERPYRVLRGGSWSSYARYARAAYRRAYSREDRGDDVGFRVSRGRVRGAGGKSAEPASGSDPRGTRGRRGT